MENVLVRVRLIRDYGEFLGFVSYWDGDWLGVEGRWVRPDGSLFREQNLRRPWQHVAAVERVEI